MNEVLEIPTSVPDLVLRQYTPGDASPYYDLVQANRAHLTRFGDYQEEVTRSRDYIERRLHEPSGGSLRLGIWYRGQLVGDIALLYQEPPRWGLGYWLSEHATGLGLMTASVAALLRFARSSLGATEIRAAVTHGNQKSVAVLNRLGFTVVADREAHTSYALELTRAGLGDRRR